MFEWIKHPWWTSCTGKKRYETMNLANNAGKISMYNNGYKSQLYMYECSYCKKWHLTSQVTEDRVF